MKYLSLVILLLLLSLLVSSCGKEENQESDIDAGVGLFVYDSLGQNLLNPLHPNAIIVDEIRLSYISTVNPNIIYNKDWDCPYAVCYISDPGQERIRLFPYSTPSVKYPITYIDWGNGDMDTLKCHFIRTENSITCDKVWFNDVKMYPDSAIVGFGRAFKIVK